MSEEPLTDIDAELRALMAVEASPEFAARVRERVSVERMGRRSRMVIPAMAAASAALVVTAWVVAGLTMSSLPSGIPDEPPVRAATERLPPVADVEGPPPAVAAARIGRPRAPIAPAGVATGSSEPEVVVDARVKAAVERLLDAAPGRVLGDPPAARAPDPGEAAADLVVEPLVVEPVPVPGIVIGAVGFEQFPGRSIPWRE